MGLPIKTTSTLTALFVPGYLNSLCDFMSSDTSRLPLNDEELNEGNYIFVTYESMLADIAMHSYLEYGSYDGALYGTKLDTIRQIHADGLIAVIDVEPQVASIYCRQSYY